MPNRQRYDINAEWDDPFEHRTERRAAKRYRSKFKLKVSVPIEGTGEQLIGLSILRDLSFQGGNIQTKHDLEEGQRVNLAFPTAICPKEMGMPRSFWGPATVKHKHAADNGSWRVGVQFGEAFLENMLFARFVEYLQSLSAVMTS